MLMRTMNGTLMDLWHFERGGERIDVKVGGWAVAANVHRDSILRLAAAGEGVIRVLDWASRRELDSHLLVPALEDWSLPDAPPVSLSYRPSARRTARVRLLIDFLLDALREMERENAATHGVARTAPHWANVMARAASTTVPGKGRRR